MTQEMLAPLVSAVLKYLQQLPDGTEISTYEATTQVCATSADLPPLEAIEFEDWFAIFAQIWDKSRRHGLILDDSKYADQVVGIFHHIPFVVRHKKTKKP